MIAINKAEKEAILSKYPDTHVVRTMKHDSKRHRYYCTEDRRVMNLLKKMREAGELHTEKGRVSNRSKAKRR
jgi:hypothetical protein